MPSSVWEFEGLWHLTKIIIDDKTRGQGRFEGEARFEPVEGTLRYLETGVLHIEGQTALSATRRYIWRPSGAGVAVTFEDGRPFHTFDFAPSAEAAHWCDPDDYRVSYDFSNWPEWTSRWRVEGPRKAYTMTSTYVSATA